MTSRFKLSLGSFLSERLRINNPIGLNHLKELSIISNLQVSNNFGFRLLSSRPLPRPFWHSLGTIPRRHPDLVPIVRVCVWDTKWGWALYFGFGESAQNIAQNE